jgi:HK97 family phage portal protein
METPILKALNAVLTRAPNQQRPPISSGQTGGLLSGALGNTGGSQERFNAMGSVGWLFAVIERISTTMAAAEWKLYQRRGTELVEVEDHPLLDLWKSPNPFYSQSEFFEDSSNHFELTGEMTWVIVRGVGDAIVELWPVRPDRIRPVPDPNDYISGYIYQIGRKEVPLEVDDVMFMRRPHPTTPYRGIGQVQGLLHDLGSEQMASAWQRNFFSNSALPGGIIEFDHNLSQQDFTRLVDRWREQHQGVSNSHRVAILERGKWTDRKYTQRDMEFKETRMLNRDIILGAYGFPHSMLGISENINRANAEAAELTFARWVIKPRLIRIRDKVNQTLVSQFGEDLFLDFVDPVPSDKTSDLAESEKGYNAGILTQNEARRRLGEGAIEGGDGFKQGGAMEAIPAIIASFGPNGENPTLSDEREPVLINGGDVYHSQDSGATTTLPEDAVKRSSDPLIPTPVEYAEAEMVKGWTRRLRHEMLSLISDLSLNVRSADAKQLELTDLEDHNWDWEERYGDDVRSELTEAFDASLRAAGYLQEGKAEFTEPITYSVAYARHRAAELLTLTGKNSLVSATRRRVRVLIAQTIERRESVQYLARALRADQMFSPSRADMLARTETAIAYGQGTRRAALSQGRDEKHWVTQGDDAVDGGTAGPCVDNESQGWIKFGEMFSSGHDTIPSHPRCRCVVRYRTAEAFEAEQDSSDDVTQKTIAEARCQGKYRGGTCNKLLQKDYVGGTLYCSRCKQKTEFPVPN